MSFVSGFSVHSGRHLGSVLKGAAERRPLPRARQSQHRDQRFRGALERILVVEDVGPGSDPNSATHASLYPSLLGLQNVN